MDIVDITKHSIKMMNFRGQKTKSCNSSSTSQEPKIILADEPVSALDPKKC